MKLQQIDLHREAHNGNCHLDIPFEAQTLRIDVKLEDDGNGKAQTLKNLAEQVKEANKSIADVSFYTIDDAIIPDNELLAHRNNIPFIMSI